MSVETKLKILRERMDGRKDGQLLLQLKRKEEELLSLASVQVGKISSVFGVKITGFCTARALICMACSLQKISKPCPVCSSAISKTEGCNKMTCSYCGESASPEDLPFPHHSLPDALIPSPVLA